MKCPFCHQEMTFDPAEWESCCAMYQRGLADGRKQGVADREEYAAQKVAEERARVVAWLRKRPSNKWEHDPDDIELGEHVPKAGEP